ncbi:MAG: hypothetical protein Q7S21_00305 [archaeon]|nr:hypothetical protein [archaeon]
MANLVELLDKYISCEKRADSLMLLNLFQSNARLIDPWGELHIGRHEIKAFYNDFFNSTDIKHIGSEQIGESIRISYMLDGGKIQTPTRAINYIHTKNGLVQEVEIRLLR